jgi:hypothetical protein
VLLVGEVNRGEGRWFGPGLGRLPQEWIGAMNRVNEFQRRQPMIPTPHQIFVKFERGEIDRDEVHSLMALHARELIGEMEEDHRNPVVAMIETLMARRAASRLVRRHGGRLVREILIALAEVPDFPPVRGLWNAAHPDVPLYCFFRIRREPVFRILSVETEGRATVVVVEHGSAAKGAAERRRFVLHRDAGWRLTVDS